MAKKESSFFNMVTTLLVITLISSTILAFINKATLAPKEATRLKNKLDAISSVLPKFDNNPADEMVKYPHPAGLDSVEVFPARLGGRIVGVAVSSTSNRGYSGDVKLMVGFDTLGTFISISVLEQKETPGLGTKMTEPKFKNQFVGFNPSISSLKVVKDGGQVDAITAATVSSRAFCDAAQVACDTYLSHTK